MRALLLLIIVLTAGCSTNWRSLTIADASTAERQLVIDEAYCRRVAIGGAPMPTSVGYNAGPTAYNVSGQGSYSGTNGYGNTRFRGTLTPAESAGDSFARSFANGANIGIALRAKKDRDLIEKGCMYKLGWTDKQSDVDFAAAPRAANAAVVATPVAKISSSRVIAEDMTQASDVDSQVAGFVKEFPEINSSPERMNIYMALLSEISKDPVNQGLPARVRMEIAYGKWKRTFNP